MKLSRRALLTTGLTTVAGTYAWQRGIRYPRLSLEPHALEHRLQINGLDFELDKTIALKPQKGPDQVEFRAFAPEPSITIAATQRPITVRLNNVNSAAKLYARSKDYVKIDEQIEGIDRIVDIGVSAGPVTLSWQLAADKPLRFAVIGDTGANKELDACLDRARELNADFLLHLGDFNYIDGEYDLAIDKFQTAPLPCFVSIGNHDFRDNGLVYQRFRDQIGPLNTEFEIHGIRFLNLDTAADFFPASAGNRGRLLARSALTPKPQVVFTHRPLKDPRPHDDHQVGGINEVKWLASAINKAGGGIYLNGHVHHSAEFDVFGLKQYTVGEGLGHEDLVLQRQVAKMLSVDIAPDQQIEVQWHAINIPWRSHLSETHAYKLNRDKRWRQLQWYQGFI